MELLAKDDEGTEVSNPIRKPKCGHVILMVLVFLISFIVLIVGIVVYINARKCVADNNSEKLLKLLDEVKESYFKSFSSQVIYNPSTPIENVIDLYKPYDASPMSIKSRTNVARELRKKLDQLELDVTKLKAREKKALAQLKHYLESTFGNPSGENYYAGDWMMGPNYYCITRICSIGRDMQDTFNDNGGFKPWRLSHVERIMEIIKEHEALLLQIRENMMEGVKAGMVRAVEDCQSGRTAFQSYFPNIHLRGEVGVLDESFAQDLINKSYYDNLLKDIHTKFINKYGTTMEKKMAELLITHFGLPIKNYFDFLEKDYSRYCVPANVVSGLSNLPIKFIWFDQKPTTEKTTPVLPTGELLSGKQAYEMILPYYTTTNSYHADNIRELGERQLSYLYTKAEEIAMKITGKPKPEAISEFKNELNSDKYFFNDTVIPDHENGEEGGRRCKDMRTARLYCPVRYKAIQKWFRFAEMALATIEPKTTKFFYMTGNRTTTPNCPLEMRATFNPSIGSQSFDQAGADCLRPAYYNMPFFLKRPGPVFNAMSVAGHEGRPGHHTQIQGFIENFQQSGHGDTIDWLNIINYYTAFVEGWALYGENPLLAKETDLYAYDPLQEYGMLKWQLWRALRLIIDTGLHARDVTMQASLDMFAKYCWDTTDKAYKDTIRYMSVPGQATGYMIGQLEIWNMRNRTEERLKAANVEFDLKEFHYQVLAQGSSPIDYLREHIDDYVTCKIDVKSRPDCSEILNGVSTEPTNSQPTGTTERWKYIVNNYPYKQQLE